MLKVCIYVEDSWESQLHKGFTAMKCDSSDIFFPVVKVRKFQNDFMNSSFLPKYEPNVVRISALYCATLLHTDAFFLSLRDINRHRSWLNFWKIQVNLLNFLSCTFGRDWEKYSKNGLTFGHLAFLCLRFFLKKLFFSMRKQNFGNVIQICVQI